MTQTHIAKLTLALAGVVVFLFGIRSELDILRWTGIALVAVAWLMRFVGRSTPRAHSPTVQSEDR